MAATPINYHIDQNAKFSTITLLPGLNDAQWSDIEQAGSDIMGRLNGTRTPSVLVDLTPLNYMGSSMVAMIVRCWKNVQSNNGRIIVICNNEVVREVISLAGLTKVWPIVESRDDALRELGMSSSGGSNDRWFVVTGILGVIAGFVGTGLLLTHTGSAQVAIGLLFVGAGVGFLAGLITLVRSTTSSRFWGLGIVLAAAVVAIFGFMNLTGGRLGALAPAADIDAAPATEEKSKPSTKSDSDSDESEDAASKTAADDGKAPPVESPASQADDR